MLYRGPVSAARSGIQAAAYTFSQAYSGMSEGNPWQEIRLPGVLESS